MALIVDLHDDDILALAQQVTDIEVERGKATNMMTCFLAIHPHATVIVDCPKVKQRATIAHRHSLKTLLKPDGTLVEEQTLVLCIPVTRDLHRWRLIEVVFNQVFRALGLGILEESPTGRLHTIVIVALFLYIDNVIPLAIERHALIGIHVLN